MSVRTSIYTVHSPNSLSDTFPFDHHVTRLTYVQRTAGGRTAPPRRARARRLGRQCNCPCVFALEKNWEIAFGDAMKQAPGMRGGGGLSYRLHKRKPASSEPNRSLSRPPTSLWGLPVMVQLIHSINAAVSHTARTCAPPSHSTFPFVGRHLLRRTVVPTRGLGTPEGTRWLALSSASLFPPNPHRS